MSTEPCEFLTWDSAFFGVRIGRIHGNRLTRSLLTDIRGWSERNSVKCLYFFARPDDRETTLIAEESGFSSMDVRVTYERGLEPGARQIDAPRVRLFEPGDLPRLTEIARTSHKDSRFYFDGNFASRRCDELFVSWIERSCSGWADAVFVAMQNNESAGYITCHRTDKGGSLGIMAVAETARSLGLGTELLETALEYFKKGQTRHVKVITQVRNIASQRLYQRSGFLIERVELTYHWWM